MKSIAPFLLALTLSGPTLSLAQDGSVRVLALKGNAAPGLAGNFSGFGNPTLIGSGEVAFIGSSGSAQGIYRIAGASLQTVVTTGQAASVIGGTFEVLSDLLLNEKGTVAFRAQNASLGQGLYTISPSAFTTVAATGVTGQNFTVFPTALSLSDTGALAFRADRIVGGTNLGNGLYTGTGGSLSPLAISTQIAPGTGGTLSTLSPPVFNNVGVAAFANQNALGEGIYTSFGSWQMTIASSLSVAPEIGGNFSFLSSVPTLNDNGTVAFLGSTGTGATSKRGVFTGSGGALTAIATSNRLAPGLGGNFTIFLDPSVNTAGTVAFVGRAAAGQGIYKGNGGALETVAVTGQLRPNGTGPFTSFGKPTLNCGGTAVFLGTSADGAGLYLGDGQEIITAAYKGQSVAGGTITSVNFPGGADRGGASQFNDNGQVAYVANLTGGKSSVLLFTPTLHYRTATGGAWGARSNWTVSILPAAVHDVFIDPTVSLTVNGPSLPTTVKSLTVNGTAAATATLALQSFGAITATDGITTGSAGRLTGNGRINGNLSNAGNIAPGIGGVAGSITVAGNATLQPTSRLTLDLGGLARKAGYEFLNVTGAFALGGALDVSLLGSFVPQVGHSFDLFDAASVSGSFSLLNLPALASGLVWNSSQLASGGLISINAGTMNSTWASAGSGWWAGPGNWTAGIPNGVGAVVTFGSVAAPTTITVGGPKTVGRIVFNDADRYEVMGGAADIITLNDDAAASINVLNGSHLLTAPLALTQDADVSTAAGTALTLAGEISGPGTLTSNGAGILNLGGAQSYATLNADSGTTNVNGSFTSGTSTVNADATTNFAASQTLMALNIGTGAVAAFGAADGKAVAAFAVVPEPGTMGLLAVGVLGILARRRPAPARR